MARWIGLTAIVLCEAFVARQNNLAAQVKPVPDSQAEATAEAGGFEFFEPTTYRLRIRIRVEAPRSAIRNVIATGPVPIDWPEQKVKLLGESKPNGARTRVRRLAGHAAMLTFQVPFIPAGGSATVQRDYEVTRYCTRFLIAPESLQVPEHVPRPFRVYLAAAPGVEVANRSIVSLAESLQKPSASDWLKVRGIRDWVRDNIQYETGNYAGAKRALEQRSGDCEDMTALFVALCRAAKIPARSVWIEGHAYAEFYLIDGEQKGYWIPAELTGPAWFGESREDRPILQKGDRILDPIRRSHSHYVPQSARATGGAARLSVTRQIMRNAEQAKPKGN